MNPACLIRELDSNKRRRYARPNTSHLNGLEARVRCSIIDKDPPTHFHFQSFPPSSFIKKSKFPILSWLTSSCNPKLIESFVAGKCVRGTIHPVCSHSLVLSSLRILLGNLPETFEAFDTWSIFHQSKVRAFSRFVQRNSTAQADVLAIRNPRSQLSKAV